MLQLIISDVVGQTKRYPFILQKGKSKAKKTTTKTRKGNTGTLEILFHFLHRGTSSNLGAKTIAYVARLCIAFLVAILLIGLPRQSNMF